MQSPPPLHYLVKEWLDNGCLGIDPRIVVAGPYPPPTFYIDPKTKEHSIYDWIFSYNIERWVPWFRNKKFSQCKKCLYWGKGFCDICFDYT